MICSKCLVSIDINDEYLECFNCNGLYCIRCIKSNHFKFNETSLLYEYKCAMCLKISSLH